MTDHDATGWRPIHTEADLPPAVSDESDYLATVILVTIAGIDHNDKPTREVWPVRLVTGEDGDPPAWHIGDGEYVGLNDFGVVAWMPWPEPYGGEL